MANGMTGPIDGTSSGTTVREGFEYKLRREVWEGTISDSNTWWTS